MITGIDLNATKDFICAADKKNPTIWKLSAVASNITGTTALEKPNWQTSINIARIAIKGWENFKINDADVAFETENTILFGKERTVVTEDLIGMIPPVVLLEIVAEIYKISKLTDTDTKN